MCIVGCRLLHVHCCMCIAGFSHFESNPGLLLVPPQIKTSWVGVNSRWGSIVSIFVFDWGFIDIVIGWGCNQDWGFNRADTVFENVRPGIVS